MKNNTASDFLMKVALLESEGLTEQAIAKRFGMDIPELRETMRKAKAERHEELRNKALELKKKGRSDRKIADILGYKEEASVRSLLENKKPEKKKKRVDEIADILRAELKEKGFVEIGKGEEKRLRCTRKTFEEALFRLLNDGYSITSGRME